MYYRVRGTHANTVPRRRAWGSRIAHLGLVRRRESRKRRDGLSNLSRSKEMERKLIGAVNVNTRMDVRDRKSGLANWFTVSPLYPLAPPSKECSLLPSLPCCFHRTPESAVSPSRSPPLYPDIFFSPLPPALPLSLSLSLFSSRPSRSLPLHHWPNWARIVRRSILHLAGSLDFWFECSQFGRWNPLYAARGAAGPRINRTARRW